MKFSLLTLASVLAAATAEDITLRWTVQPYADEVASVGDTITFDFTQGHDVHIHPTGSCDPEGSILVASSGPATYTFTDEDAGRSLFFACQVGSHCVGGEQHVTVTVQEAEGPAGPGGPGDDNDDAETTGDPTDAATTAVPESTADPTDAATTEEPEVIEAPTPVVDDLDMDMDMNMTDADTDDFAGDDDDDDEETDSPVASPTLLEEEDGATSLQLGVVGALATLVFAIL